ncbi:MAG: hypothetical protein ACFE68_05480 [Candidatus Hodarchaeota archaeon]
MQEIITIIVFFSSLFLIFLLIATFFYGLGKNYKILSRYMNEVKQELNKYVKSIETFEEKAIYVTLECKPKDPFIKNMRVTISIQHRGFLFTYFMKSKDNILFEMDFARSPKIEIEIIPRKETRFIRSNFDTLIKLEDVHTGIEEIDKDILIKSNKPAESKKIILQKLILQDIQRLKPSLFAISIERPQPMFRSIFKLDVGEPKLENIIRVPFHFAKVVEKIDT